MNLIEKTFKNKTIMILGDSISDESTQSPNWVSRLREYTSGMNTNIINHAYNGGFISGIGEIANRAENYTDTNVDIVIIEAGTNDCNIQASIGTPYDNTYTTVLGALNKLNNTLINKYPTAIVYYIIPPKVTSSNLVEMNAIATQALPRCIYRYVIECQCTRFNWNIIDATYGMPRFNMANAAESIAFSDNIHPLNSYSQTFMDYIVSQMVSGGTTKCGVMHSAYQYASPTYNMTPANFTNVNGELHFYSDGRVNIKFVGKATASGFLPILDHMAYPLYNVLHSDYPQAGAYKNDNAIPIYWYGNSLHQILVNNISVGDIVVADAWLNLSHLIGFDNISV